MTEKLIGGWPAWALDHEVRERPIPRVGDVLSHKGRLKLVVAVEPGKGKRPRQASVWLLAIGEAWVGELIAAATAAADGARFTASRRARLLRAVAVFRPVAVPVAVQRPAGDEDRA